MGNFKFYTTHVTSNIYKKYLENSWPQLNKANNAKRVHHCKFWKNNFKNDNFYH